MERVKRKKSKMPCLFGGNGENPKQKTVQSSSCSDRRFTTEQDLFKFEAGQSSSRQVTGTPMKNLLAKEMSNEISTKKRSPSIIAKLMGLDGMPSPQPIHRQQRRMSDSSHKSTGFLGGRRNEKLVHHESDKNGMMEQQQFKDVYVDPEASHVANRRCSSQRCPKRKVTKQELAYIREKCDEVVWESNAMKSKLERVDSNSELMLNFLQQPDSLFVKHLHDQQGTPSSSLCSHIAILKPSNAVRYESYDKEWKEPRDHGSCQRHEDGLLGHSRHCTNNSHRSTRVKLEVEEETGIPPTRIVVLKPNIGKSQNAMNGIPSPDGLNRECFSSTTREAGPMKYTGSPDKVRSLRFKSREAREIARQITSRVREGFGYVGNESLYNTSRTDSPVESEGVILPSRNSFDLNDRPKPSRSSLFESSVSREAKKRMSERWKTTHGYKDGRMNGEGSTLGEMLSIPDNGMRGGKLDAARGLVGIHGESASPVGRGMPLGISSRDGWRETHFRSTSRSRSVPPSLRNRNHKTRVYHEVNSDEKVVVYSEPHSRGRSKGVGRNSSHSEDSLSKSVRYDKRCRSSKHRYSCSTEFTDSSPDNHSNQKANETYFDNEDPAELQPLASEIYDGACNAAFIVDAVVGDELKVTPESAKDLSLELSPCILGVLDSSTIGKDSSNAQEPLTAKSAGTVSMQLSGPEPESSESSKEADHCSPISVLEVPAAEDVSSGSDCFERVNCQLHELRKQLELLKMESGSTCEGLTLVPDDEEVEQGFSATASVSDSWESTYLLDVLHCSGFYETDPYTFMTSWYNVDCPPTDPWLFDRLEKKYMEETSVSRSDRRLLYDRINEAILRISNLMVSCSWVSPVRRGIQTTLPKFGFEDQLRKLLAKQEKEADEEYFDEIFIDNDPEWFQPLKEVDIIGKQIAELLINDIVLDVLTI